MKKFLNKFNFILGIVSVMITYFPGMLIGEFAIIILKALGRAAGIYIIIFVPIIFLKNLLK